MTNLTIDAINSDGTISLTHYGSQYKRFWVSDIKRRRTGNYTAYIHGQRGGSAMLCVSKEDADAIDQAQRQAKQKASETIID
jgi:3-keto-L-gulonate-6-phosphate decarboxylase